MNRRAFSILELTLATLIGTLVLATALGVFASMERGDAVLAQRAIESSGLEMTSAAVERAMSTLVMESGGQGAARAAAAAPGADAASRSGQDAPAGRARFLLETDTTPSLPGMPEIAAAKGAAPPGALHGPQRMEVVVARHPTPLNDVPPDPTMPPPSGAGDKRQPADERPLAVRGVFDLRPEAPKAASGDEPGPITWSLWWRPLERGSGEAGVVGWVARDDLAARLATGLISAQWAVFYNRAWEQSHATTAVLDLPAYVQLRLVTATGLEADWLFEVGWSMGPEFKQASSQDDGEEEEGPQGGDDHQGGVMGPATGPGTSPGGRGRTTSPGAPPKRVPQGPSKPPAGPQSAPPSMTPGKPAGGPK